MTAIRKTMSVPPFRADRVGGLLRPAALRQMFRDRAAGRIDEASRHVDIDRLAIGPQCGLASTAAGNPLSEADRRAKLARCVEVASIVWAEVPGPGRKHHADL